MGLAVLVLVGCAFPLGWIGAGSYTVAETYGGLGGGWAQILSMLAVGAGVVVGGLLVVAARLLGRATPARWLVLAGVALALLAAAVGARLGSEEHAAASERAEHACGNPVSSAPVSFAEGLESGPLARQNGPLGRNDETCQVSPDGVSMTFDASYRPESMSVVELEGRRADR